MEKEESSDDNATGTTVENVMCNIYAACDCDCKDQVAVSKLIQYITPFMQGNLSHLMELKSSLDPDNVDPNINSEVFYAAMRDWTKKFELDTLNDSSFQSSSPRHLKIQDRSFPFISTPRASFGNRLATGLIDPEMFNVSANLGSSFLIQGPGSLEKTYLEDQIKELVHKNKKCSEELLQVKLQLGTTEEQNDAVQAELEKLRKCLAQERDINEQLQKEHQEFEECKDVSFVANKRVEEMKRSLVALEKKITQLNQQIEELEAEKLKYEEKIAAIHKKMSEYSKTVVELQTELAIREKEALHLTEINEDLRSKLSEELSVVEDLKESNEFLQIEKDKLQKMLHERFKTQLTLDNMQSQTFSEYTTKKHKNTHTTDTSGVPFQPAIDTEKFSFYNIDSPIARRLRADRHSIGGIGSKSGRIPKLSTSFANKYFMKDIKNNFKDTQTTKIFNTSATKDQVVFPIKGDDQVAQSPPYMYVVDRSPSLLMDDSMPTDSSTSPAFPTHSEYLNSSNSEDNLSMAIQLINNNNNSPHESLQAELNQVIIEEQNRNCKDCLRLVEMHRVEIQNLNIQMKEQEDNIQELGAKYEDYMEKSLQLEKTAESRIKLETDNINMDKQCKQLELTVKKCKEQIEINQELYNEKEADLVKKFEEVNNKWISLRDENIKLQTELDDAIKIKEEIILKMNTFEADCSKQQSMNALNTTDYKLQIYSLEEDIKTLEDQLNTSSTKNITLEEANYKLEEYKGKLLSKLEIYKHEKLMQANKQKDLDTKLDIVTEKLFEANEKIRRMETSDSDKVIEMQNKLTCLENELKLIQASQHSITVENTQLKSEITGLNSKKLYSENQLELVNHKLITVSAELVEANAKISSFKTVSEKLNNLKNDLEEQLKTLIITNETARLELESKETEINRLRTQIADNTRTQDLSNSKILYLKSELSIARDKIRGFEDDTAERIRMLDRCAQDKEKILQEVDTCKSTIKSNVGAIGKLNASLREAKVIATVKHKEIEKLKKSSSAEVDMLKTELAECRQEVAILMASRLEVETEKSQLEEHIRIKLEETELLTASVASHESKLFATNAEVLSLRKSLTKITESLNETVTEYEAKLKSAVLEKKTKSNHDRMQIKMEKLQSKIDYLQEQLEAEACRRSVAENNLVIERNKSLESTKIERTLALKRNTIQNALADTRQSLRRGMFKFSKKWRKYIDVLPGMETVLDQVDNDESDTTSRGFECDVEKEIHLLKKDAYLFTTVISKLENIEPADFFSEIVIPVPTQSYGKPVSKFTLRPPVLDLSRPVSPDSPNLEIEIERSLALSHRKPDSLVRSNGRLNSPDSAGVDGGIAVGSVDTLHDSSVDDSQLWHIELSESDEQDTSVQSTYDDALTDKNSSPNLYDLYQLNEIFEKNNLTEEELEKKITEVALHFTVDVTSIEKRLKCSVAQMNKTMMEVSEGWQRLGTHLKYGMSGQSLNIAMAEMNRVVSMANYAPRLAEQFGALKEERKILHWINLLINYATSLKKKLDQPRLCQCINLSCNNLGGAEYRTKQKFVTFRNMLCPGIVCVLGMMIYVFTYCCLVNERGLEDVCASIIHKEYGNMPPPI